MGPEVNSVMPVLLHRCSVRRDKPGTKYREKGQRDRMLQGMCFPHSENCPFPAHKLFRITGMYNLSISQHKEGVG